MSTSPCRQWEAQEEECRHQCSQTVKEAGLVAEIVGRREPLTFPFPTIVQCHLHSCFQAEEHVRSSNVLLGEYMRAREKGHISSAREANSLHIETISSEKVERTIPRDNSNSTAPVKKKSFWFLIFLKDPYLKIFAGA